MYYKNSMAQYWHVFQLTVGYDMWADGWDTPQISLMSPLQPNYTRFDLFIYVFIFRSQQTSWYNICHTNNIVKMKCTV